MTGLLLALSSTVAFAAPLQVETQQACRRRAEPDRASKAVDNVDSGLRTVVMEVATPELQPWYLTVLGGVEGWLGPECVPVPRVTEPSSTSSAMEGVNTHAPKPKRSKGKRAESPPSYGGVFLGRAGSPDPVLGAGGQLSVGGMAMLRVEDSSWFAGMSAATVGGSRFQRQVVPYVPVLGSTGGLSIAEGIGNVASIYTDIRHLPLTAFTGYGWQISRFELFLGGGPSAHRVEVRRREQVSGVQKRVDSGGGRDENSDRADELELTTYTIDRLYAGGSKRWAAGVAAHAGALVDAGSMPFVNGRWSLGILGSVMSPIGRQGCADVSSNARKDLAFGTICVPMSYTEERRLYYNQGKENTDSSRRQSSDLVLGVTGFTWSVNSVLFFQF